MKKIVLVCCVVLMAAHSAAAGTVIVSEDFESYADTAALNVAWSGGPATLDTGLAFSGSQSAAHGGGTVNNFAAGVGSLIPSLAEDLVLTGRIYDDGLVPNDRITIGLRTGAAPLFEMGRYNSFNTAPAEGPQGPTNTYGIRGLSLGNGIAPSPNWFAFDDGGSVVAATEGWHTYEATFSVVNGLTVTLDLLSDGTVDHTLSFAGDGASDYNAFTDLRFGGPSNLSSAGGGANFDDISLALVDVIPEPSTLMLAGLAGLSMIARRK